MKRVFIITLIIFSTTFLLYAGNKGDEEGEYLGAEWPSEIPKTTPVKYYLPFPAGKSFGQLPGAASHTSLQNKYAIDFAMPIGSPVRASADGVVIKIVESGPDRGGTQNSLIIRHADGMCTCYLHLKHKGVIPKLGDFVFAGDTVAYSGASGTGVPHLHFSVNKEEMLECVKAEFVESKSQQPWVSQNYSFEEKYAKQIAEYKKSEIALTWAPQFGIWADAIALRKSIEQMKPKEEDDFRLKKLYKKVEEKFAPFDEALKNYLAQAKTIFENKDYPKSIAIAKAGIEDFKGTEHEKIFTDMLAELEKLPNYKELCEEAKPILQHRTALEKALRNDLGNKLKKALEDYSEFTKKYKDFPETEAVKKRIDEIKVLLEEKK